MDHKDRMFIFALVLAFASGACLFAYTYSARAGFAVQLGLSALIVAIYGVKEQ